MLVELDRQGPLLDSRLGRIRFLLDRWDEVFDPSGTAPWGSPGDGSGCALLPLMSRHPSIVELERCLRMLFAVAPGDFRHLKAFRCGCEWRLVDRRRRVRLPSGKRAWVVSRERERVVPRWLDEGRVLRAELWLEARFRGEVFVPKDLWDGVHGPLRSDAA